MFEIGTRVVLKEAPQLKGTIIGHGKDGVAIVDWDFNKRTDRDGKSMIPAIRWHRIEIEDVFNSPLYKALQEDE